MRNFVSRLFCAVLILIAITAGLDGVTAAAERTGTWGKDLVWLQNNQGVLKIWGKGPIPSTENNGDSWFIDRDNLSEVIINEGITGIENNAFWNCPSLTSVTLPDGLTNIGTSVFAYCSSLTSINLPDGLTDIGEWAFYGCKSLESITIPGSVTGIGDQAFDSCDSLTSVMILDGVEVIGDCLFRNCKSLTSVIMPDSITYIGKDAFKNCPALTSVTVLKSSSGTAKDGQNIDSSPTSSTSPASVSGIGERAFYGCSALTSVMIPGGISSIGEEAFMFCSSLTSVSLPQDLISIGVSAFSECQCLTSVTIPDGVTNIGKNAFKLCSSLTSVTIPDSVTSIEEEAFAWCPSLASVTIPDSVTNVEAQAFRGCSSLTSITIPNSVTSIGAKAFAQCDYLSSVTIPAAVAEIGEDAFSDCSYYLTIVTEPATYAEEYCRKNKIAYVKSIPLEKAGLSLTTKNNVTRLTAGNTLQLVVAFEHPDIINKKEKNDQITWFPMDTATGEFWPYGIQLKNDQLKVNKRLSKPIELLIRASSVYGTESSVTVTLVPIVTKVNVDPTELILYVGSDNPQAAKASLVPNTVPPVGLTWTPANKKLISITETGEGTVSILPLEAGKTSVTVKEPNGKTATLKVSVLIPVESVELTVKGTVKAGALVNIVPAVLPKNAGSKSVTYSLDVGEDIAKINKEGQLRIGKDVPSGTKITVTCTSAWAPAPVSGSVTIEIP